MNIDWDDVAQEADDTPRSLLAEVLGRVDEWHNLIIITVDNNGQIHHWSYAEHPMMLAMLSMVTYYVQKQVADSE